MRPIRFAFWPVRPDVVLDNIRAFEAMTGLAVAAEAIPDAAYTHTIEQRLRAGAVDVFYAQRGEAARWNALGLIEHLETEAAAASLVARMDPAMRESSHDGDGHLLGLTYYNAGPFALFRNEPLLARAGFAGTARPGDYPSDWDEVTRQAAAIRRAGLSDAPILPRWHRTPTGLVWSLIAQAWSAGERFADDGDAACFGLRTPMAATLGLWRRWWTEGLVPPEALGWKGDATAVESWMTGRHAWHLTMDYQFAAFAQACPTDPFTHNSPGLPGGSPTAAIPGHALLCMGRQPRDPARREAVLRLLRFLGGDDPSGGFAVPSRWIRELALPQPFAHLMDDGARASLRGRFHAPLADEATAWLLANRARGVVPRLVRAPWFTAWSDVADAIVGDAFLAKGGSLEAAVTALGEAWEDERRRWRAGQG